MSAGFRSDGHGLETPTTNTHQAAEEMHFNGISEHADEEEEERKKRQSGDKTAGGEESEEENPEKEEKEDQEAFSVSPREKDLH